MCDAAKHVSETGKGRGFLKLRRQQKRLEVIAPLSRARTEISLFLTFVQSVKVAKKPKSYAQTAVNDQDEDDVVEDAEPSLEGSGESKDKKSFNFTGDVLYSVCAASAENNTGIFFSTFCRGMAGNSLNKPLWPGCRRPFPSATFAGVLVYLSCQI